MSRPQPSYITKDDVYTLNAVRKDIWSNGLYGLGLGALSGLALHSLASLASKRGGFKQIRTNRNTAFLSVMLGGAIGSFVLSTTAGKNDVHQLHSIFESGSRESRQQRMNPALQRAVEREDDLDTLVERHRSKHDEGLGTLSERMQREKNRLIRRASVEQGLKSQHGLSDSHGGHWTDDSKKN